MYRAFGPTNFHCAWGPAQLSFGRPQQAVATERHFNTECIRIIGKTEIRNYIKNHIKIRKSIFWNFHVWARAVWIWISVALTKSSSLAPNPDIFEEGQSRIATSRKSLGQMGLTAKWAQKAIDSQNLRKYENVWKPQSSKLTKLNRNENSKSGQPKVFKKS